MSGGGVGGNTGVVTAVVVAASRERQAKFFTQSTDVPLLVAIDPLTAPIGVKQLE